MPMEGMVYKLPAQELMSYKLFYKLDILLFY